MQAAVDAGPDFPARSALAKDRWAKRANTVRHDEAFTEIKAVLSAMTFGSVRCAYCEDSAVDEIEHIAPKTVFPSRVFDWTNYCYVCGPCNGPKSNRHAVIDPAGHWLKLRLRDLMAEPSEPAALLDPRIDDYKQYLEIDIGGVTPGGQQLQPTSHFKVLRGIPPASAARGDWTIEVLRLNREVVRFARETALQAYRACLREYADDKLLGKPLTHLEALKHGIMRMPHPAVFNELIRQASTQPKIAAVIAIAPEVAGWIR